MTSSTFDHSADFTKRKIYETVREAAEALRAAGFTPTKKKLEGRVLWTAGNSWPMPTRHAIVCCSGVLVWAISSYDPTKLVTASKGIRALDKATA